MKHINCLFGHIPLLYGASTYGKRKCPKRQFICFTAEQPSFFLYAIVLELVEIFWPWKGQKVFHFFIKHNRLSGPLVATWSWSAPRLQRMLDTYISYKCLYPKLNTQLQESHDFVFCVDPVPYWICYASYCISLCVFHVFTSIIGYNFVQGPLGQRSSIGCKITIWMLHTDGLSQL